MPIERYNLEAIGQDAVLDVICSPKRGEYVLYEDHERVVKELMVQISELTAEIKGQEAKHGN